MSPELALSVISLLRSDSVAFGCEADMRTVDRSNQSDVNDSGCVKTHTSAKCRKYNSPTLHRAVCAQHDLTPWSTISSRYFLRAQRSPGFSHSQDPQETCA